MEWNLSDKFLADDPHLGYRCNESKYVVINVDDYDAIYPDVPMTQNVPHCLIADKSLPANVHDILIKSRHNLISITGFSDSEYVYYKKRLEVFSNITWV